MTPLKDALSMSFSSDGSGDMMEDADALLTSPPRSAGRRSFGSSRCTKTRLLFDDGEDGSDQDPPTKRPTPPRHQRPMLRTLDLNHDLQKDADDEEGGASSSVTRRKRSSAERRGEERISTTPRMDTSSASSDSSFDQSMHTSPHISPNSFLTLDGRFVQSKNPFSSPMVTEQEQQQHDHLMDSAAAQGPSLPTNFGLTQPTNSKHDINKLPGFLPPRHRMQPKMDDPQQEIKLPATQAVESMLNSNNGYPDRRFSFTGSPIQEHHDDEDMMEMTDTANSGSLHKVRRFNRSDDIVAATGQHLASTYQHRRASRRPKDLTIDTTTSDAEDDDKISPADVLSFPTPPTPIKAVRPRHQACYRSIRQREPSTPSAPQRNRDPTLCPPRTPHPASFLQQHHHHHDNDDREGSNFQIPKSRFANDFDIIDELGRGSFGTVYKVLSRLDGCMYAIKEAQRKARGAADRDNMLKEVYALAALSDQAATATFHIVRYHQAWMEDDRLYIQTELCTGTLSAEIANGTLTVDRRYKVLREVLLALDFLHQQQMVHLDIKPDNIFIKNDQYKLGDFGLVTFASNNRFVEEGDSRYMSMELLAGKPSDLTKSDIFSLGATIYEVCLGRSLPMNGQEWQDIRAGHLLPLPDTPHDMSEIIKAMMDPDPANRPAASKLLKHRQLLSNEQKAFIEEKTKATLLEQKFQKLAPKRLGLTRANTWNGSSTLPYP